MIKRARASASQDLLIELLHELDLFFAHGALNRDFHLRAPGAMRSQVFVVLPAIGWSRYFRNVARKRWSIFAVVSKAALACDGCWALCPIGSGPETMSDVDVHSGDIRELVSDFGHQAVQRLTVRFDHQRLVPEVVEQVYLSHIAHTQAVLREELLSTFGTALEAKISSVQVYAAERSEHLIDSQNTWTEVAGGSILGYPSDVEHFRILRSEVGGTVP